MLMLLWNFQSVSEVALNPTRTAASQRVGYGGLVLDKRLSVHHARLSGYAECRPESRVHYKAHRVFAALGPDFQNLEVVVDREDKIFVVDDLNAQHAVVKQKVGDFLMGILLDSGAIENADEVSMRQNCRRIEEVVEQVTRLGENVRQLSVHSQGGQPNTT